MKVMVRETLRFLPGKMTEGTKLLEESLAYARQLIGSFPSIRKYTPWLGGGSSVNTIIIEVEYENLSQMAEFFEKTLADPKMKERNQKWELILESSKEELYMVIP